MISMKLYYHIHRVFDFTLKFWIGYWHRLLSSLTRTCFHCFYRSNLIFSFMIIEYIHRTCKPKNFNHRCPVTQQFLHCVPYHHLKAIWVTSIAVKKIWVVDILKNITGRNVFHNVLALMFTQFEMEALARDLICNLWSI